MPAAKLALFQTACYNPTIAGPSRRLPWPLRVAPTRVAARADACRARLKPWRSPVAAVICYESECRRSHSVQRALKCDRSLDECHRLQASAAFTRGCHSQSACPSHRVRECHRRREGRGCAGPGNHRPQLASGRDRVLQPEPRRQHRHQRVRRVSFAIWVLSDMCSHGHTCFGRHASRCLSVVDAKRCSNRWPRGRAGIGCRVTDLTTWTSSRTT